MVKLLRKLLRKLLLLSVHYTFCSFYFSFSGRIIHLFTSEDNTVVMATRFGKMADLLLACKVVCCSHQSDHRVGIYVLHQSDCRIKVSISHHSDSRIRVWISNQSYHRIWISQRLGIVFLQMISWIKGMCKEKDVNQKFWARLRIAMVCDLHENLVD